MKKDATARMLEACPGRTRTFEVGLARTTLALTLAEGGIEVEIEHADGRVWRGSAEDAYGVMALYERLFGASPVRFCEVCAEPMDYGFTDGGGFCACERCFEDAMDEAWPVDWRATDAGRQDDEGGCYEALTEDGEWVDTGVYYTEWFFDVDASGIEPARPDEVRAPESAACALCGKMLPPFAQFCPNCGGWAAPFLPDDSVTIVRRGDGRAETEEADGDKAYEEWNAAVMYGDAVSVYRRGHVCGYSRPNGALVEFSPAP